ncbi:MAG TPA: phosphoethanolamine--lipid A transferase [Sedimenticola sp.]|nr:phosphoethanolamine--lipid A transferase [Sedimenticola sp.]
MACSHGRTCVPAFAMTEQISSIPDNSPYPRFSPAWLWLKPRLSTTELTLVIALFLLLFDNAPFWRASLKVLHGISVENIGFVASLFIVLLLLFNLLLSLVCFKYIFKPLVVGLLVSASVARYFMDAYGVMLDRTMVQNVMQTDYAETFELLNLQMLCYLLSLGFLPSIFVLRAETQYKSFTGELRTKLVAAVLSLLVAAALVFCFYQDYSSLARNNRYLRHLINPVSYLYSLGSYVHRSLGDNDTAVEPLGKDAVLTAAWKRNDKKNLVILVLGETARQMNFSLNGYQRETNPLTGARDVISFKNFYSCGTATAVSVPCMFSHFDRSSYSDSRARRNEGLLDVLSHAGVGVLWRDNNSGCKGTCDRVKSEKMARLKVADLCNSTECHDEILLHGLQQYIDSLDGDALIVLHQKGSHGPAYYLRYPKAFEKFTPVCATNQLRECRREEIVNAYDNTILYTDYVLAKTIDFLKANSERFNTAMMYVSDHGESLGESNLYLHGLPYFIAPEEQKRVPFMLWFSDGFEAGNGIDTACLRRRADKDYSHDNIFHSVLGLMGVSTAVYDAGLDLFAGCRD